MARETVDVNFVYAMCPNAIMNRFNAARVFLALGVIFGFITMILHLLSAAKTGRHGEGSDPLQWLSLIMGIVTALFGVLSVSDRHRTGWNCTKLN